MKYRDRSIVTVVEGVLACQRVRNIRGGYERAIRRAGELMREFDGRDGRNLPSTKKGDTPPFRSKRDIAAEAGMSADQQKQATAVARIPEDEFNTSAIR